MKRQQKKRCIILKNKFSTSRKQQLTNEMSFKKDLPNSFIKTAKICGIEHLIKNKGHFYVEKNKILSYYSPKGIKMKTKEIKEGVKAEIVIKKGVKIRESLFFCFGLLGKKDNQFIIPNIIVEEGAEVKIFAHCSFPHAQNIKHRMKATFKIKKNANFYYEEHHYHGENSGAAVYPKLKIEISENSQFLSNFILSQGTLGKIKIEVETILDKNARTQIITKAFGRSVRDQIEIMDKIRLEGEGSRSIIKMRAAAKNGGKVLMQGETYANATGAIGHVDCQEIVIGKDSIARAVPIVEVNNDQARVTHEASVGKINQKELETLMTRGLNEDEATELIINSMIK